MKKFLTPLLAAAALSVPAAYAQKVGDSVTPEVFGKLEWVQGEGPTAWEPGKLYVLECWATWCGPCIAAIPHVDALYDKYQAKGLRVIGVNVWEDGKDKVVEFVKKKGEGMSYPVAYTGKGGAFETTWLKPAGVQGIPHAFLVKDGKVIAGVHPMKLTDELVESLLQEGEAGKSALEAMNAQALKDGQEAKARMAFSEAAGKNDADGMAAAVEALKSANPKSFYIPLMANEVLVARGDWASLDKLIDGSGDEKPNALVVSSLGMKLAATEGVPKETLQKVIAAYEATPELTKGSFPVVALARLQWQAGDKDKAVAKAKEALELTKELAEKRAAAPSDKEKAALMAIPVEPFERLVTTMEGGSMPSAKEFGGWMMENRKAVPATAATPVVPAKSAE